MPTSEKYEVAHHPHHGKPLHKFCLANGTFNVIPAVGKDIDPQHPGLYPGLGAVCSSVFDVMCAAPGPLVLSRSKPDNCAWCQTHPLLFFIEMYAQPVAFVIHNISSPGEDLALFRKKLPLEAVSPQQQLNANKTQLAPPVKQILAGATLPLGQVSTPAQLTSANEGGPLAALPSPGSGDRRRLNKDWVLKNGQRGKPDKCYWDQYKSKTVCPEKIKKAAREAEGVWHNSVVDQQRPVLLRYDGHEAEEAEHKAFVDQLLVKVPESIAITLTHSEVDYVCVQHIVHVDGEESEDGHR